MPRPVGDQVVVVTGASSGVGRAIVRALGAKGAKVALLARTEEALENAAKEIREAGGEALVVPTDVSSDVEVENAARAVIVRWGRIDTWISPLPGDRGAHGAFDAEAVRFSPELWARMHRGALAAGLVLLALGGLFVGSRPRSA